MKRRIGIWVLSLCLASSFGMLNAIPANAFGISNFGGNSGGTGHGSTSYGDTGGANHGGTSYGDTGGANHGGTSYGDTGGANHGGTSYGDTGNTGQGGTAYGKDTGGTGQGGAVYGDTGGQAYCTHASSVPEPSTLFILGSGLAGFAAIRRLRIRFMS